MEAGPARPGGQRGRATSPGRPSRARRRAWRIMKNIRVAEGGGYVSLSRARWLVAARRARFLGNGELLIGASQDGGGDEAANEPRTRWTAYSNVGLPNPARVAWLRGVRMNGAAMRSDD